MICSFFVSQRSLCMDFCTTIDYFSRAMNLIRLSFCYTLGVTRLKVCPYDFKVFLRRRDRGELLVQNARKLFSNLLRERPMAISGMYICFGYQAQIIASEMPFSKGGGMPTYGLALSGLVTDKQVDYMQTLSDGCMLTMSPVMTPCCRNTFTIVSTTGESRHGDKLVYGEDFMLQIANYDNSQPLYMRYVSEGVPTPPNRMPIVLSSSRDSNCRWKAIPLLAMDRLEGDGSPVKQGDRLIIKNCVADKNLCVMYQTWMQTFFGPECGITVRTYLDIHKRTTAENIFKFKSDVETKKK